MSGGENICLLVKPHSEPLPILCSSSISAFDFQSLVVPIQHKDLPQPLWISINMLLAANKELRDCLVQLVVDSIKVLHDRMLAPEAPSLLGDAGRPAAEQVSQCKNI